MDFPHPRRAALSPGARRLGRSERRRQRAAADAWIARGHESRAGRYGWRVDELTSASERKLLARSLRRLVDELSPARLPGAAPLNRPAIRPHAARLIVVAKRLEELNRPVGAAGVLAVQRLLTGPDSPLYDRELAGEVGRQIQDVLDALEVH